MAGLTVKMTAGVGAWCVGRPNASHDIETLLKAKSEKVNVRPPSHAVSKIVYQAVYGAGIRGGNTRNVKWWARRNRAIQGVKKFADF